MKHRLRLLSLKSACLPTSRPLIKHPLDARRSEIAQTWHQKEQMWHPLLLLRPDSGAAGPRAGGEANATTGGRRRELFQACLLKELSRASSPGTFNKITNNAAGFPPFSYKLWGSSVCSPPAGQPASTEKKVKSHLGANLSKQKHLNPKLRNQRESLGQWFSDFRECQNHLEG